MSSPFLAHPITAGGFHGNTEKDWPNGKERESGTPALKRKSLLSRIPL